MQISPLDSSAAPSADPFFVFLDFDGVLNSREFFDMRRDPDADGWAADIDPRAVSYLNDLLGADGRVVVSSTWRYTHNEIQLDALLREHGFTGKIVGLTPDFRERSGSLRGDEVQAWLQSYYEAEGLDFDALPAYVILDDCTDFLPEQAPYLFLTDNRIGLTRELCQRASAFVRGLV